MVAYPIDCAPSKNWIVFTSPNSDGFPPEYGYNISITLGGVCLAFNDFFGKNVLQQYPNLIVLNSKETPQCFKDPCVIFLCTSGNFPLQHIYQFAHELCHFVIHASVCDHYRWLEESMCELMSWCVLFWVYNHREDFSLSTCVRIYDTFPSYISNSQQDCIDIKDIPLGRFISQNAAYLQRECYDRRMNRAIANELFPLFVKYPELWHIVLQLPLLTDEMPLDEAVPLICHNAAVPDDLCSLLQELFSYHT